MSSRRRTKDEGNGAWTLVKATAKIDGREVECQAGNVYLVVAGEWNESYLDELCLFPGGSFKDQVDASSGASARLVVKREIEMATTTFTGMY